MSDDRPNREIVAEFRKLLTEGFYTVDSDGVVMEDTGHNTMLARTKPWRSEIWKAFRELENRLCPQPPKKEPKT